MSWRLDEQTNIGKRWINKKAKKETKKLLVIFDEAPRPIDFTRPRCQRPEIIKQIDQYNIDRTLSTVSCNLLKIQLNNFFINLIESS